MTKRATRVRAESRRRIEPLIQPLFKFQTGMSKRVRKENIDLYLMLSTDFGWYYLVRVSSQILYVVD